MRQSTFNGLCLATNLVLSSIWVTSCDKGAGSFSLLADSQSFTESVEFTPRKIDVLFVVDNSGSMKTSQDNLADNFSSFISKFIEKGFDFKIAVTTTEAYLGDQFLNRIGCTKCKASITQFKSGTSPAVYVIDQNNYDLTDTAQLTSLKETFSANVKVGTSGYGDERAFSSLQATLNSSLNTGFHRSDAFLAIIIVSDEDDFSQSGFSLNESYSNSLLYPIENYNNYLQTFTGGQPSEDYSVSIISVLDSTCLNQIYNGAQKIGTRYKSLATLTGGSQNSLCDSFDTSLDSISTQILTQAKPIYALSKYPNIETIKVVIDGTVVPNSTTDGWSYDDSTNSITINGSTYKPDLGSQVSITFEPDLNKL